MTVGCRSWRGLGLLCAAALPGAAWAQAPLPAPWDSVGRVLQAPGAASGGYYRYAFPRRDLTLQVGDVTVNPALALGAWVGFAGPSERATMMGDLVVTGSELLPALQEFDRQGIAVTGIHNHLVGEAPPITYVHFHAEGNAIRLAAAFDRVLARTGAPRPVTPAAPAPVTADTALVFSTLGLRGRASGAVVQLSPVLVSTPVTHAGRPLVPALAYPSPINVQVVGDGRAVATGDFAVVGEKVGPLVQALTRRGITTTAIHNHLIGEAPTLHYVHFWADGPLAEVLRGLRAALDAVR